MTVCLVGLFIVPIEIQNIFHNTELATIVFMVLLIAEPIVLGLFLFRMRTNRVFLTNERLVRFSGLLHQDVREIPLIYITNVNAKGDLLQRMLNCGTLEIDVAGGIGTEILPNIPNPDEELEAILAEIEQNSLDQIVDRDGTKPRAELQPALVDPLDELSKLHHLLEDGVIDSDDYVEAKHRLLQRV